MNRKRRKILIADDDPGILEAVSMILRDEGYEVVTTVDGETVYRMEKDFPDLLLLDIWMSGIDGREICRHLKNNDLTREIPIIMVSANRDTGRIALKAGADDFITKPFELEALLKKIRKNLARIRH